MPGPICAAAVLKGGGAWADAVRAAEAGAEATRGMDALAGRSNYVNKVAPFAFNKTPSFIIFVFFVACCIFATYLQYLTKPLPVFFLCRSLRFPDFFFNNAKQEILSQVPDPGAKAVAIALHAAYSAGN